ncbi:glutathione S-transferase [Papilio machaon]|uniref:glutathione S-transferase n=1 Tax=Papilio machaon TaxID=76193 RepID=UPI001E663DB2|nr:glutathione S-transferase [Papilio machaon]
MAKKLHYFDLNGIAESIRYLLHYGGQKFEDIRYEVKTWPDKNIKDMLPFGQLPLYEEGNMKLTQSLAIARYVALKVNLLPTDPWEQALLDSIVLTIYDFWTKVVAYFKEEDPKRKAELKREILEETIDFYFSRFEKQLKDNKGYFNGKLSWVDFVLIGIVEASNLFLGVNIEKKYPTVDTLMKKILSLPGVKDYVATRKPYVL